MNVDLISYVPAVELLLRFIVAALSTITAVVIIVGLRLHYLRPRGLFTYMWCALALFSIGRWVLVGVSFVPLDEQPAITVWLSPVLAGLSSIVIISVLLIVLWRYKEARVVKKVLEHPASISTDTPDEHVIAIVKGK